MIVLAGEVQVEQYDRLQTRDEVGIATLRQTSTSRLAPGGWCWFGAEHGNLHGLRSISDHSVVLDILCERTPDPRQRSYYFPTTTARSRVADALTAVYISDSKLHDLGTQLDPLPA
jgi:hypothetical protein